tara:strand:+ start:86 stop:583 length:498 start_codon:yes stop_codon:yes gene_type:complete
MFPVDELVLKKQLDELSEQTFCGYITGHHVCIANHIQQTIQDRCILDPLTYQALYSPDKQFNISGVQQLIDQFNDTHDQSSLLDVAVLIKHPTNTQFIQETVFADSDRKYSTDVAQYLNDAALFESTFIELYERLDGLASDLVIVEPFTSNRDILKDITLLAAGL